MNTRHACCITLLLPLLAACKPEPPPTERPPEPQATAAGQHTELRDAIQAPQDKARAVEDQTLQAADTQRAAIDAQAQ